MLVPCGAVQSRSSTVGAIVHLVSRSRRPRLDDDQAERLASSRTAQACCYARPGAKERLHDPIGTTAHPTLGCFCNPDLLALPPKLTHFPSHSNQRPGDQA